MVNEQLINPRSIVVVGGSENLAKPGGKVLKNLIEGSFKGALYVLNPKLSKVQGVASFPNKEKLPEVDLAVLAIAAGSCLEAIEFLATQKKTRAFIILSAGFSEENKEGARLEQKILEVVERTGSCLIGPNCIGFMNENYQAVFTTPIPDLKSGGIDFISGSGATAVFIMESGLPKGLLFSSVWSVGNSTQTGVEDVLEYLDSSYKEGRSSRVKLLYLESIKKPEKLLKHAASLVRKGCKIAAIKAGVSEAGSRAASSHTGALASSDIAADALFRKAGIIRCYGREELTTVAAIFMHPLPHGRNLAVVTHAGGPAVMLTDALSAGGINVPVIEGSAADELLQKLYPGSSVANPIDFLATGNAGQLEEIIKACEEDFTNIDAIAVIFGSPGLFPVSDVYDLLDVKMKTCKKPIYPILPSVMNVKEEIKAFLDKDHVFFPDEVVFGKAFTKVMNTPVPTSERFVKPDIETTRLREIMQTIPDGWMKPEKVGEILDAVGIPRVVEKIISKEANLSDAARDISFPWVMKVVGPLHKTDVGGVVLNVETFEDAKIHYEHMIKIPGTIAILIQPMMEGLELFAGAHRETPFEPIVMCGMGGIFVEILKDVSTGLSPLGKQEAMDMIHRLKMFPLIDGVRGKSGVNIQSFANILVRLSELMQLAPEISELDLNPLLGKGKKLVAVDARIRVDYFPNTSV